MQESIAHAHMGSGQQEEQLPIIRPEQLQIIKQLGQGSFAVVWLAWLLPDDGSPGARQASEVAVKRIRPAILANAVELQLFRREVETLQRLHHRYIVRLIGAGTPTDVPAAKQRSRGEAAVAAGGPVAEEPVSCFMQHAQQLQAPAVPMYLVQEFMPGGPLSRVISADMARAAWEKRGCTLRDGLRWATNIAEALIYLHTRNPKVIHRDLKLSNILLSSTNLTSAEALVADFGLHASVPQQSQSLLAWSSKLDHASVSCSWSSAADLTHPLEQGVAAPLPPSIPEAASLRSPFSDEPPPAAAFSVPAAAASVPGRQQRAGSGASDGDVRAAASLPAFVPPGSGVLSRVQSSKPLSDILARTMSSRTSKDSSVRSGKAALSALQAPHTADDVADLHRLFSSSCNLAMQRKGAFASKPFRQAAASSAAAPADAGPQKDGSAGKWRRSNSSGNGGGSGGSFLRQQSGLGQQDDSAAGGGRISSGNSAALIAAVPPAAAEDMRDSITSATSPPVPAVRKASKAGAGVAEAVRQLTARTGSLVYMAPEVFLGRPYDEKADVFSFAIMLWEMLHNQLLQLSIAVGAATADAILLYAISMAEDGYRPPISSKLMPALRSLLTDCWAADPAARPDMQSVLARLQAAQQELPLQRRSLFSVHSRDGSTTGSAAGSSWTANRSATFSRIHSPPPASSFRPGPAASKDAAAAGDLSDISRSAGAAVGGPADQQRGCFGCC